MWWMTLMACGVTPTATLGDLEVHAVSWEGAEARLSVDVDNPWPLGTEMAGTWTLTVGGQAVAAGEVAPVWLAASDHSTVVVPLRWRWGDVWAASAMTSADVPYRVDVVMRGGSPMAWSLPLSWEGTVPVPRTPTFELLDWRVDEISLARLSATLVAFVDLPVEELGWAVRVGAVPLFHGELARAEGRMELPLIFELGRSAEAVMGAMQFGVGVEMHASLRTPFGLLPVAWEGRWLGE